MVPASGKKGGTMRLKCLFSFSRTGCSWRSSFAGQQGRGCKFGIGAARMMVRLHLENEAVLAWL